MRQGFAASRFLSYVMMMNWLVKRYTCAGGPKMRRTWACVNGSEGPGWTGATTKVASCLRGSYQQTWYDPREHDATFVVAPVLAGPSDPFTQAQVRRIFGPPAHVLRFTSQFIIMTYDKNLLTANP